MLIAGGAGATGVYLSGAFDVLEAGRPFNVGVSSDDEGLLGIDIPDPVSGNSGDSVTLLVLTNRFSDTLDSVSVDIDISGGIGLSNVSVPSSITPGDSEPVTAQLSCSSNASGSAEVTIETSGSGGIEAPGSGVSVTATRTVNLACIPDDVDVDICTPLDIPGCIDDTIPGGWSTRSGNRRGRSRSDDTISSGWSTQTDCSVVITTDDFDEQIGGAIEIGGALVVNANDDADLELVGSAQIGDHLRVDAGGDVDFGLRGNASIGNVVQLKGGDDVTATIQRDLPEGFCAEGGGDLDVTVTGGAFIDGEVWVTSEHDDVDLDIISGGGTSDLVSISAPGDVDFLLGGDTHIGQLDVDGNSDVDITGSGGSIVDGRVDVRSSGDVDVTFDGNEQVRGRLTIETTEDVDLELTGSSEIQDDVTIETEGDVDVSLVGNVSITGSVTIETDGDVTVTLTGSSSIGGDLTIETDGDVDVSDCSSVGGTVTPEDAC